MSEFERAKEMLKSWVQPIGTREAADHIGEANEKVTADHAELARLAEAIGPVEWFPGHLCRDDHPCDCAYVFDDGHAGAVATVHVSNGLPISEGGNDAPEPELAKLHQAFIAAANPATVLSLLSEIAALRGEVDVLEVEKIGLRAAIFGSHDYDPSLRHGNFIEMARQTEEARKGALSRATQAERQRDELRKALEDHDQTSAECRIDGARPQRDTTAPCELCGATQRESCGRKGSAAYAFISTARTLLANQGADQ